MLCFFFVSRRHNAGLSMGIEHDRGSPDVNIGSYKRITGSLDKPFPCAPPCAPEPEPPAPQKPREERKPSVEEIPAPAPPSPLGGHSSSEDSISLESSSFTEDISPSVETVEREFTLQISVEPNISIDSEVSCSDLDHNLKKSPHVVQSVKLQKLRPRPFLPEETLWEAMRCGLVPRVPPDSALLNLLCMYPSFTNFPSLKRLRIDVRCAYISLMH